MAGKSSAATVEAFKLVVYHGVTRYDAALRAQLSPATMYRSKYNKMWLDSREGRDKAKLEELKQALDVMRPRPRPAAKKAQRFATKSPQ